jgi:hypothetical protein
LLDSNADDMNLGDFIGIGDHQHPLERATLRRRQGREDLVARPARADHRGRQVKSWLLLPPPAQP